MQALIFMYFTPTVTVTGIFLINAIPSLRWRLLEGGVLLKLSAYYRGRSKERRRLLEDLLCHKKYDFGI